jgi:hypothetical protein
MPACVTVTTGLVESWVTARHPAGTHLYGVICCVSVSLIMWTAGA